MNTEIGVPYLKQFHESVRPLNDADRLAVYDAIFDYGFTGKPPKNLPPTANGVFTLIKLMMDSPNVALPDLSLAKNCPECGNLFIPTRANNLYCKSCTPQKRYNRRHRAGGSKC